MTTEENAMGERPQPRDDARESMGHEDSRVTDARPEPFRECPLCGRDNRGLPRSRYSRDGWQLKSCCDCGFLYLENPPPVASLASEHNWSESWTSENQRRLAYRPLSGRLRALWKQWRSRRLPHRKLDRLIACYVRSGNLLDIGCGTGDAFSRLPASLVPQGIEIDPHAMELAQSRAASRGGHVLHADALAGLDLLEPETMQGVVMQSFLEHDVHPLAVLRAAQRVLAPDGAIIIKVPNVACWNRRYWHGQDWPGFRFPDHVNYFTPQTLVQFILKADLTVLRFGWRDRLPTSDNMWLVAGGN